MIKVLIRPWNWFGSCLRSAVAWTFMTLHAVWFFAAVNAMGPPSRAAAQFFETLAGADWLIFAGRPFHFYYEPSIVKSLVIGDLPANIVCAFANLCLSPVLRVFHVGTYAGSYIGAGEVFLAGSLQWLAIGRLLDL